MSPLIIAMDKVNLLPAEEDWQDSPSSPSSPRRLRVCSPITQLKTMYLLVASDLKTTLLPATIFAIVTVLSGSLLTTYKPTYPLTSHEGHHGHGTHMPSPPLHASEVIPGLAKSICWTLLCLLIFNLANQRLPDAILEDQINKPYRCIPSGRLTPTGARRMLLALIPTTFLLTHYYLGGRNEAIFLMVATWMYNDLGAGDEFFLIRHLANAVGFITFAAGAAAVAIGPRRELNGTCYQWLAFLAVVITFTIQFQDMEDQEGDSMRDRKTMPLLLGDELTRRINAVMTMVFTVAAPVFWQLKWWGYVGPIAMGGWIAFRCLSGDRGVKRDKTTFKLWCLWLVGLYLLPIDCGQGVFEGLW